MKFDFTHIFTVYLDELSNQLVPARVGCTVGKFDCESSNVCCVFGPGIRPAGFQCSLNTCGDYPAEHEITFNCDKSSGVRFSPKQQKQPASSNVFLSA